MQQRQTEALGREPVGKLLLKLATPAISAQIINLLYNLVDRMYIGHIQPTDTVGRVALTGVGVCLPLIMLITAFAYLGGMGSAPRASIFLGKGDQDRAEETLGNAVTALVGMSIVLTLIFFIYAEPMLRTFGANDGTGGTDNTLIYGLEYMRIYALGTTFVLVTLGLNTFISAQGFTTTSMLTVLIGAVSNIILDPIFIFALNMGVAGAALATILSQCISMIWILLFLTGKKTTLHIRLKYLRPRANVLLPSLALGLSPFIMMSTESLLAICFNTSLRKYGGDLAVGTMTILTSVMQFSNLPLQGLTQGAQPILSYNYGAGNADRVRRAFRYQLICAAAFSTALWIAVQLAPQIFIYIFNDDPNLVTMGRKALRIYMAVSCLFSVQLTCQQTFVALGNAKSSLFLALLRKVILLIPLIYIMPAILPLDKTTAVFIAEPVADTLAVITTASMFFYQFRRALRRLEDGQPAPVAGT